MSDLATRLLASAEMHQAGSRAQLDLRVAADEIARLIALWTAEHETVMRLMRERDEALETNANAEILAIAKVWYDSHPTVLDDYFWSILMREAPGWADMEEVKRRSQFAAIEAEMGGTT
jgi:hypothetical protein